jgi:hypothetical protein
MDPEKAGAGITKIRAQEDIDPDDPNRHALSGCFGSHGCR